MYYQHANNFQNVHKAHILLNRNNRLNEAQFASFSVISNSLYLLVTAFVNAYCRSVFQYILNYRSIGSHKSLVSLIYYISSIAVLHFMNNHNIAQQR